MNMDEFVRDFPTQIGLNIALHAAVTSGDESEVLRLLGKGAIVNSINCNSFTTVHIASALGHANILRHLLEHSGDTERPGLDGLRPIHMLKFTTNAVACLEELKKYNVNINGTEEEGSTLLQCLLNSHECDIQKIMDLLEFNFDVNSVNIYGNSCLHSLALNSFSQPEKLELAKAFIKKGTNLNARNMILETALHIAVLRGSVILVQLFLRNDADIGLTDARGHTPMDVALKHSQFNILTMLLKHAVIKKHRSVLSDTIMERIETTPQLRRRFRQYEIFLNKLKEKTLSEFSYVTCYHILISDQEKVVQFLRNELIVEGFLSSPFFRDSFYAVDLREVYNKAVEMRDQEDVVREAISVIVGHKLPEICVNKIASFFNVEDAPFLKQFVKQK